MRHPCSTILFPGDYGVHVKFNDEHVPESPATLYVAPESADAKKVTLVGLRDRGLEVSRFCVSGTSDVFFYRFAGVIFA